MRLAVILGTRPEIIKLSPVVRALDRSGIRYFILHSGQHYSHAMDRALFDDLNLRAPEHALQLGSGTHGRQTGQMLANIEEVLIDERPAAVVVQGDTNTALAGALAAAKLGIPIAHVEAGLRSYDRTMPEEINRVLIDRLSDLLLAPTPASADNLRQEGLPEERIHVTGNTIVDAVQQNLAIARERSDVIERLRLEAGRYLLVTVHRQENVDRRERFASILAGLRRVARETGLPVVFPIHPRAQKMLEAFGLDASGLGNCPPMGFFDFLTLEAQARLVLTDSGGVQEEACILGTACVTLRDNTERPETIDCGANVLVGAEPERIAAGCRERLANGTAWQQPLGDGLAGERIARTLAELLASPKGSAHGDPPEPIGLLA